MRLAVGPWTLERQVGRPYFGRGYRLEPVALVLRATWAKVVVPMEGEPRGHASASARVVPIGVRVVGPDGRQAGFRVTPAPETLALLMLLVTVIAVAFAWRQATERR